MTSRGRTAITFTLSGRRYELTRTDVESRLAGVAPDAIRKHAVRVNDIWFPAIQAFEVATGIPRSEFISHTAGTWQHSGTRSPAMPSRAPAHPWTGHLPPRRPAAALTRPPRRRPQ